MRGVVGLLAVTGVCVFLAKRGNLGANCTVPNWEEVSAKVSQNVGSILKHILPFVVAVCTTVVSTVFVSALAATKIYPVKLSETTGEKVFVKEGYLQLSTSEKVSRALALVGIGAAVGGLLGKVMTSALHLNPNYFRNTTVALTVVGAGVGGLIAGVIHIGGTRH